MAHGLTNAVILPFALEYNSKDKIVADKLAHLSYLCGCENIVDEIRKLKSRLGIPNGFKDAGITEKMYQDKYELLLAHAMLGATNVNPVKMTEEEMEKMLATVFYGEKRF